MTTKAKTEKKKKEEKVEKQQVKKSKFAIAWEKMEPNQFEIVDMRAILK